MRDKNVKPSFSLAVKLNILITGIVLAVSLVLISVSYQSYTKTAFMPAQSDMADTAFQLNSYMTAWTYDGVRLSYLTDREELERVLDVESWELTMALETWLSGFRIGDGPDEVLTTEEYEAYRKRMKAKAAEEGVNVEDIGDFYDWVEEHEPGMLSLGATGQDRMNMLTNVINTAVGEGVDWIHLYAEKGSGYVELVECIDIRSKLAEVHGDVVIPVIMDVFGKRFEQVEEIERYKAQGNSEDFRMDTDKANLLVNVMAGEKNGVTVYAVYARDVSEEVAGQRAFLLRNLLIMGLLAVAAVAVSLLILSHMATRPILELTRAATGFAAGNEGCTRDDIMELDIRSRDEIGTLYREIRSMQTRIVENTEHITQMTVEKERLSTELELARHIQEDMLPRIFPAFPERKDFDIYASMDPAKEVGGDFYDFFLIDEDHLALVIADVSGKGVPAALFMMSSKIILQEKAKAGQSPAKILAQLNNEILATNGNDMFITVWLGILELSTGRLTASNAGHEYPLVKHPGGGFDLVRDKHSFVVGSLPDEEYAEYQIVLEPGSKLFVYTDGVPEACRVVQDMFGMDRLLAAVNEYADRSPEEILHHIRASVDEFVGSPDQFDDLTMLCLEYHGSQTGKQPKS